MIIIGLDISARKPGWAMLVDGKLKAAGVVRRDENENPHELAARTATVIRDSWCLPVGHGRYIAVEVQRGPILAVRRKAIMECVEMRGRILQELGCWRNGWRNRIDIQASNEKKFKRRARIELKYSAELREMGLLGKRRLAEDGIEGLAVADKA